MAGQCACPGTACAADQRSSAGAQSGRAADGGSAACAKQSACHSSGSRGPAASRDAKSDSQQNCDPRCPEALQSILLPWFFV